MKGLILSLGCTSMLISGMAALSFLQSPRLRAHPGPLIIMICLTECFSCFYEMLWGLGIPSPIFSLYQMHFGGDIDTNISICFLNNTLYFYFEMSTMIYNIALSLDITLVLYNPFYPPRNRLKYYHLAAFLIPLIVTLATLSLTLSRASCVLLTGLTLQDAITIKCYVIDSFLFIFITTSIISYYFTSSRLLKNELLDRRTKTTFVRKNVLYVLALVTVWSVNIIADILKLIWNYGKYDSQDVYIESIAQNWFLIQTLTSGTILGLIRFTEPYMFRYNYLLMKKALKGGGNREANLQIKNLLIQIENTNCSHAIIQARMNLELIHIILDALNHISMRGKRDSVFVPTTQNIRKVKHFFIKSIKSGDSDIENINSEDYLRVFEESCILPVDNHIESESQKIIVTEYFPEIFARVRYIGDFVEDQIYDSLRLSKNKETAFKAGESQGASGSFFFFSHDQKLIIKTINQDELKVALSMVNTLYSHYKINPHTLLGKIFGIYSFKLPSQASIHIILMESTLTVHHSQLYFLFDLKGSRISRYVKPRGNQNLYNIHSDTLNINYRTSQISNKSNTSISVNSPISSYPGSQVLKDINFLIFMKDLKLIRLSSRIKDNLLRRIEKDVKFLKSRNIMDYSLLLGISIGHRKAPSKDKLNDREFTSIEGKVRYHFGIIDYLQIFGNSKKMERFAKLFKYHENIKLISAVPSAYYAKRFYEFIKEKILL